MKALRQNSNAFFGKFNGRPYLIEDEVAEKFYKLWQNLPPGKKVK